MVVIGEEVMYLFLVLPKNPQWYTMVALGTALKWYHLKAMKL